MKYSTLNLGHTLKYDSKTQTIFLYLLYHFLKNRGFTLFSNHPNNQIWSTKIFSTYTIWKYTLLCLRKWKKSKLIFWTVWLVFSHWVTYMQKNWSGGHLNPPPLFGNVGRRLLVHCSWGHVTDKPCEYSWRVHVKPLAVLWTFPKSPYLHK